MHDIKKVCICLVYLLFFCFFASAENFDAKKQRDNVITFFQDVVTLFCNLGNTSLTTFQDEWLENGIEMLDSVLEGLTYSDFQKSIDLIKNNMEAIENSGELSLIELKDFKQIMSDINVLHVWSIKNCKLPENKKLTYSVPEIAILESNAQIHKSNIQTYEQNLSAMQPPEEIQKILAEETQMLKDLRENNKRNAELENHVIQLGAAYANALSNQKRWKEGIKDEQKALDSIPILIEKYKEEARLQAEKQYKKEIVSKINNIQTWIDFFNEKNETLTEFLQLIDTKGTMREKLNYIVPSKDLKKYEIKLNTFIRDWKLE